MSSINYENRLSIGVISSFSEDGDSTRFKHAGSGRITFLDVDLNSKYGSLGIDEYYKKYENQEVMSHRYFEGSHNGYKKIEFSFTTKHAFVNPRRPLAYRNKHNFKEGDYVCFIIDNQSILEGSLCVINVFGQRAVNNNEFKEKIKEKIKRSLKYLKNNNCWNSRLFNYCEISILMDIFILNPSTVNDWENQKEYSQFSRKEIDEGVLESSKIYKSDEVKSYFNEIELLSINTIDHRFKTCFDKFLDGSTFIKSKKSEIINQYIDYFNSSFYKELNYDRVVWNSKSGGDWYSFEGLKLNLGLFDKDPYLVDLFDNNYVGGRKHTIWSEKNNSGFLFSKGLIDKPKNKMISFSTHSEREIIEISKNLKAKELISAFKKYSEEKHRESLNNFMGIWHCHKINTQTILPLYDRIIYYRKPK